MQQNEAIVIDQASYIYRFDWPITISHDTINKRERLRNLHVILQSMDPRKVSCRITKRGNTTMVRFKLTFFLYLDSF